MPAMTKAKSPTPQPYNLDRVIRLLISALTLGAVIWLLRYLSDVLAPFVVALMIAYLMNPVVNAVERRIKNRAAAVLTTVFGVLLLIGVVIGTSVPLVTAQISDFRRVLSGLRERSAPAPDVTEVTMSQRFDALIEAQTDPHLQWLLEKAREIVTSNEFDLEGRLVELSKGLVPGVWGVVTGAFSLVLGLTGVIVILLYVIFLLNDFRLVERAWKDQLPPEYRASLVQFLDEFRVAMSRYFRGQFVVASCTGLLFAVGFTLIGLRMGILLGLFIGVLNMVPYLQAVGAIPAAILAILRAVENDTSMTSSLLLTGGVFLVVQVIQDGFLTPRIMGKATGLRPAVMLLAVFVWGKLLGFLGVVLAIPLTCLGLAYYRRWVLKLKNVQLVGEE